MSPYERELLLETARAIAELLENNAEKLGTSNNHAEVIRKLIDKVRPK